MPKTSGSLLSLTLSATLLIGSGVTAPALAAGDTLSDRTAHGDITQPGGARRLQSDQTAALKAALSDRRAKNVILLIGDGMGDSEITAARNYALGAGKMFPGIDALPVTGQYTHDSLDNISHKPNYVTDSAASATAWSMGVRPITARWG